MQIIFWAAVYGEKLKKEYNAGFNSRNLPSFKLILKIF